MAAGGHAGRERTACPLRAARCERAVAGHDVEDSHRQTDGHAGPRSRNARRSAGDGSTWNLTLCSLSSSGSRSRAREVARIGRRSRHHQLGSGIVIGAHEVERGEHTLRAAVAGERADPDERFAHSRLGHRFAQRVQLALQRRELIGDVVEPTLHLGRGGVVERVDDRDERAMHRAGELVELRAQVGEMASDRLPDERVHRATTGHLRRCRHIRDVKVPGARDRVERGRQRGGVAAPVLHPLPLLGESPLQLLVGRRVVIGHRGQASAGSVEARRSAKRR